MSVKHKFLLRVYLIYIITIYNIVQREYTLLVCVLFVCIMLDVILQTA